MACSRLTFVAADRAAVCVNCDGKNTSYFDVQQAPMTSACGHMYCNVCIERLFSGVRAVPCAAAGCSIFLTKSNLSKKSASRQAFERLFAARRRVYGFMNRSRNQFANAETYGGYLTVREDLVHRLCSAIPAEVLTAENELVAYTKANEADVVRNRSRRDELEARTRAKIARAHQQRTQLTRQYNLAVQRERQEKHRRKRARQNHALALDDGKDTHALARTRGGAREHAFGLRELGDVVLADANAPVTGELDAVADGRREWQMQQLAMTHAQPKVKRQAEQPPRPRPPHAGAGAGRSAQVWLARQRAAGGWDERAVQRRAAQSLFAL